VLTDWWNTLQFNFRELVDDRFTGRDSCSNQIGSAAGAIGFSFGWRITGFDTRHHNDTRRQLVGLFQFPRLVERHGGR
jgi:hypothetical protein